MTIRWIQASLRRRLWWIQFQELNREGWKNAYLRRSIQNRILETPPLHTPTEGDIEVRSLTWRADWKNLIWALKSFYHFSGRLYPLYIHDGGLTPQGQAALLHHFPNAAFLSREYANRAIERLFSAQGLSRCIAYRKNNTTTLKLFDFFALSQARTIISIDSDALFFANPVELLDGFPGKNLYNRDASYWYSMSLDDLEKRFQFRPVSHINSGIARINRCSIDFPAIEEWLKEPRLFADNWVTEQTLHALCSTRYGVALLPSTYVVSTEAGMPENVICKHYPGTVRPLLYQEGMQKLAQDDFLAALSRAARSENPSRDGAEALWAERNR